MCEPLFPYSVLLALLAFCSLGRPAQKGAPEQKIQSGSRSRLRPGAAGVHTEMLRELGLEDTRELKKEVA